MSERIRAVERVATEMTPMGNEVYTLWLTCGCTVRRLRRRRRNRTVHPAPKRVKHQCSATDDSAQG
jgi:hypothetical protein